MLIVGFAMFPVVCVWWLWLLCAWLCLAALWVAQSDLVGFDFCGFFLGRFGLRFACFAASDFVCVW